MKILVIKMSSMGDVIHTLPAITDAKKSLVNLEIDWVVEEGFQQIPSWHPGIRNIFPIGFRRLRKNPLNLFISKEWKAFKNQINQEKYDLIIDAQGLLKSAFIAKRIKNTPIVGLDKESAREPLASFFYHKKYKVDKNLHAVERVRQLFSKALAYHLPDGLGSFGLTKEFVSSITLPSRFICFIHATTWPSKHWPEEYWQQLAQRACEAGYSVCIPWSNEIEKQRANKIASVNDNVVVLDKMSLYEVAAMLKKSQAVVAVDTGLGHLTAALNIPAVSLYGPTSPLKVGAYGKNQRYLEAKEFPAVENIMPHEMSPITPDRVWQELQYFLLKDTVFHDMEKELNS